jgi:pimeloyl-ACP methyl ester carboxylesterase
MLSTQVLALIHSPLVGPSTWSRVADELRIRDIRVIAPSLAEPEQGYLPTQFAALMAEQLAVISPEESIILIGHSGAGPLLPLIRQKTKHTVDCYVFVDAGIPKNGASYLDLLASEMPEQVESFRQLLDAGGLYPTWDDEMLHPLIPDRELRHQVLNELHPRSKRYFEDPLPVFSGWPDAPCYYLQLSSAYDVPAAQARQAGWAGTEIKGGHFHMLVEPAVVTAAILHLLASPSTRS